jgi:hypothetical protein
LIITKRNAILPQTHLVMPLAAGVVEGPAAALTLRALEQSVHAKGHVDTGLTGTYFMYGAILGFNGVRSVHESSV